MVSEHQAVPGAAEAPDRAPVDPGPGAGAFPAILTGVRLGSFEGFKVMANPFLQ